MALCPTVLYSSMCTAEPHWYILVCYVFPAPMLWDVVPVCFTKSYLDTWLSIFGFSFQLLHSKTAVTHHQHNISTYNEQAVEWTRARMIYLDYAFHCRDPKTLELRSVLHIVASAHNINVKRKWMKKQAVTLNKVNGFSHNLRYPPLLLV